MLKVELHAHSADDPIDRIPHTTRDLIDRASALGYDALAVTLHERQLPLAPFTAYAAARGVTLIPGIERSICGKHVLLLNFSPAAETVNTFDDLARLRARESGLVVAPHPFFPAAHALNSELDAHGELFDAVEWHALFTPTLNFNRRAREWAKRHGKPMVGNGDVHRLRQFGSTYSLVDAAPHPDAICQAIRGGRVEVRASPRSWASVISLMADLTVAEVLPPGFWQDVQLDTPEPLTVGRRLRG